MINHALHILRSVLIDIQLQFTYTHSSKKEVLIKKLILFAIPDKKLIYLFADERRTKYDPDLHTDSSSIKIGNARDLLLTRLMQGEIVI
jgi:hypothetical protein